MNLILAIVLILLAFLGGALGGMYLVRKQIEKEFADNPRLNAEAVRTLLSANGQKPSEAKVQQVYHMRQLPHEEIVYIGDSARAPYGPRPAEQIREYTWQLVNFLLTKDVKMIVIACNTATAVVWEEIKAKLDIPVLGVILPGASAAIKASQGGRIGVIGTPMTVKSDIYRQKIHDLDPDLQVESLACPKFAPLVESGALSTSVTKKVVYETLRPLVGKVDSLILGCTHYPLLRPIIQNVMGPKVQLIDSGAECVRDISVLLNYFEINRSRDAAPLQHRFYTTANSQSFAQIGAEWLEKEIHVEHVTL